MSTSTQAPELVLCIPGPWVDHAALVRDVALLSEGYLFAGRILMGAGAGFSCEVGHERPDPRMAEAFACASPHWRDTPEMAAIAGHQSVVYLIGRGGSRDDAEAMMRAAAGLVRAGGLGVKVENTGLAHAPAQWLQFIDDLPFLAAHNALVVFVGGDGGLVSCGMHNFGLRDASVDGLAAADALALLREFTRYLLVESPPIQEGQTFATATDAPWYRIEDDTTERHGADSLFRNPYGTWRLVPIVRATH